MDKARLEILPRVWADCRRCVYLEEERVLAVADPHLGYAWAHRFAGQMMPLQPDGVRERLLELCAFYKPETIAVLGDIVHRAVPVAEIEEELVGIIEALRAHCGVKLILGNHDKGLKKLLRGWPEIEFHDAIQCGRYLLAHGNENIVAPEGALVLIGHEHPAISLGDGVRSARFPCFLLSERVVVLPAFSRWAAGANVRAHSPLAPLVRQTRFARALAILDDKLLPVRL